MTQARRPRGRSGRWPLPRRHPRQANQLTAGSIANERKKAVNKIPMTLDSFEVRSVMSMTPQIPAMRTRTPRIVT